MINDLIFEKLEYIELKEQINKIEIKYLENIDDEIILKTQIINDIENMVELDNNIMRLKAFNKNINKHSLKESNISFFYLGKQYIEKLNFNDGIIQKKFTMYEVIKMYKQSQELIFQKLKYFF